MIESDSRSGTIRSLQHLRVVAASLIILYHSELQISRLTNGVHEHSLGFGAAGTDLFFVIGGFILVYTSSGRRDTLGTFLYRRIMRIAPLYWVFTILMLAVLLIAPGNLMTTKFDAGHFLASLAFVPFPHPVLAIERPFLFPGWVLNYFVFFYLLFGSLLALSVARRIVAIGLVLCTLALLQSRFPGASHLLDFYGAPIVLDFVMGMIVAWLYLERRIPSAALAIVFLAGLAVFTAGVLKHVSGGDDRALYWGTADAAFLLVCVFIERQWGWPNWGFLSSLGDASYSVFVSHLFTLALVTSIVRSLGMFPTLGTIGVRILFVVAAWAVGMLVYVTIERPLTRRLIPRPAARSLAAVAAKSS